LAREEYSITHPLVQSGVVARIDLIRIQRQVADLEGEINTIRLTIPRLQTAAKEAKERVQEVVYSAKTDISNELNRIRAELNSVTETLLAGEDRVTRTEVRSRVRGTVKEIKQNTVGGVIRPGEDIIEIVPLDDTLLIEAQIRPADIAFLRPGQEAMIKIAAYDFSIYGGLKARVEHISADTIKDEQGENFYRVYLRTAQNALLHQGNELPIIPGMTATIEILTGHKSVLDYIMKPILKARDRALRER
jgi:adhesin transport system membrane fusion protein